MRFKPLMKGLLSYLPGVRGELDKRRSTGGTNSARYCYSVWLRHLILLYQNGMNSIPHTVAEIGPGDSLGIGLAALLSGVSKYYGFDIILYSGIEQNLKMFREITSLFTNQADIPDDAEFPDIMPRLDNYRFPTDILKKKTMDRCLNPARLKKIEHAIRNMNNDGYRSDITITYKVPWDNIHLLTEESVDLIYSQAVMEHVLDLDDAYAKMYKWLRKNSFISHQIDYKAHELDLRWYAHWTYPDSLWKILMHGRAFSLNRYPHSVHVSGINRAGFGIVQEQKYRERVPCDKSGIRSRFKYFKDDDYTVSSSYIIARKE